MDWNLEKEHENGDVDTKETRIISTYGQDNILCNIVKSTTPHLTENKIIQKFQYVKKTAPSLRNTLSNSKQISLQKKYGKSNPCNLTMQKL